MHNHPRTDRPSGIENQAAESPPNPGRINGSVTHVTSHAYDANGNRRRTTDPALNVTETEYWPDDLVRHVKQPSRTPNSPNVTSYVYDPVGNVTEVWSPAANAGEAPNTGKIPTLNTYTHDNLLETTTVPIRGDGTTRRRVTYGYDDGGRKTSQHVEELTGGVATRDGGTQTFAYYPNDRLKLETGRNGETISYEYDQAGNRTSVDQWSATDANELTGTYYLDDLPRSVTDPAYTTSYSYDAAGRRAARDHGPAGSPPQTTTYTYNDAGLPISQTASATGGTTTTWTYDAGGRPATRKQPNGQNTTWTHNPDDSLASAVLRTSTSSTSSILASWTYTYDNNYRQLTQTYTGTGTAAATPVTGTQTYTYGTDNRLSSVTEPSGTRRDITFDRNGNRTQYGTVRANYNADDTIATFTDTAALPPTPRAYAYTPAGAVSNDGCAQYTYDGFDRMSAAAPVTGSTCAPSVLSTYLYDGTDRQRAHIDPPATGGGTTTTAPSSGAQQDADAGETHTFVHYDGWTRTVGDEVRPDSSTVAYTLSPDGTPLGAALRGPNVTTTTHHLADDGYGTTTIATTASRAVACTARFGAFGEPLRPTSATNPCNTGATHNDIFYRGGRRDAATGTYQLGARTYNPATATFTTPDSYRNLDTTADLSVGVDPLTRNRYAYVNGDPVNLADPDGHEPCYIVKSGGGSQCNFGYTGYIEQAPEEMRPRLEASGYKVRAPKNYNTKGRNHKPVTDKELQDCAQYPIANFFCGPSLVGRQLDRGDRAGAAWTAATSLPIGRLLALLRPIAAGARGAHIFRGAARNSDAISDTASAANKAPNTTAAAAVPAFARSQYGRVPAAERAAALERAPTCPYCGQRTSTQVDHITALRRDWDAGGWADDFATRTGRVNDPDNLVGACASCNGTKQARELGEGPGQWWPPGWPSGTWWPYGP